MAEEIDFHGHTIGKKGMIAMLEDISAVKNYKKPTSKEEMLSFLGLASFQRNMSLSLNLLHRRVYEYTIK
jgi:hypothetical protein